MKDQVTVQYERKYSDGNYGSEGLSLTLVFEQEDMSDEQALTFAHHLKVTVLSFLAGSAAERVAWAAKRELEAPEREARIRESAEYELAAGLRDAYRGEDAADADPDDEDGPF